MIVTVAVIAALSLVQSLFGVGLLVFGTPTLLLLGASFPEALAVLLPASIAVSLLQARQAGNPGAAFWWRFGTWCLLPLVVTLAMVLAFDLRTSLNLAVALLLGAFVLLRVRPGVGAGAVAFATRHDRPWLVAIGVVHGLSNLGGALLLVFAASRHQRKEQVRGLIAYCYVAFAASQLAVLALVAPSTFGAMQLVYAAVAAAVFTLVGQRTFAAVSAPVFDRLLNGMAASYAGLLGLRAAGVF